MKFMKIWDLEAGDLVCIDSNFLYNHYRNFYRFGLNNEPFYITKTEKSKYSDTILAIHFPKEMYKGDRDILDYHIEIFEDEVYGDYPIKIIELGND